MQPQVCMGFIVIIAIIYTQKKKVVLENGSFCKEEPFSSKKKVKNGPFFRKNGST